MVAAAWKMFSAILQPPVVGMSWAARARVMLSVSFSSTPMLHCNIRLLRYFPSVTDRVIKRLLVKLFVCASVAALVTFVKMVLRFHRSRDG